MSASRVIVITGSARGIGRGLATEFLGRGHPVVISDLHQEALSTAVNDLASDSVTGHLCDVTDPEQLRKLWQAALDDFGRVDIWINNAGVGSDPSAIRDTSPALLQRVLDTMIQLLPGWKMLLKGLRGLVVRRDLFAGYGV